MCVCVCMCVCVGGGGGGGGGGGSNTMHTTAGNILCKFHRGKMNAILGY